MTKENIGKKSESLREAASRFFPGEHRLFAMGGSPGYSSSTFARVESSSGQWFLRRWPPSFEERKLRFVHRALTESRLSGFSGVPVLASTEEGETVVRVAGSLFDCQEQMAGNSLSSQRLGGGSVPNVALQVPPGHLATLSENLARFHRSTARLSLDLEHEPCPLPERLRALATEAGRFCENLPRKIRKAERGAREVALRWLTLLPAATTVAREVAVELPEGQPDTEVLCHGDLWPAHVRFDGESFAGFTDFESLAFASPAFDLAQLVAHFGSWESCENVVRHYETLRLLSKRDRAALPVEGIADLAAEGLWSLGSLYGDLSLETTLAQRKAHELNLHQLLGSLEQASEEAKTGGG